MNVTDLVRTDERPAYVRFERVPVPDPEATKAAGMHVAKDVDYALITPAGSRDVMKFKVSQWFVNMEQDIAQGRMPEAWMETYKEAYKRWKTGQEIPLNGVPIKGWGVISPAQQETLIALNVRTVEDLATLNDEGSRRVGMGGVDLKNKAKAWLAQMQDKGPLTIEMSRMQAENANLQGQVATLTRQVAELHQLVKSGGAAPAVASAEISASEIFEEDTTTVTPDLVAQYTAKFGKPPHHMMKPETIAQKLRE